MLHSPSIDTRCAWKKRSIRTESSVCFGVNVIKQTATEKLTILARTTYSSSAWGDSDGLTGVGLPGLEVKRQAVWTIVSLRLIPLETSISSPKSRPRSPFECAVAAGSHHHHCVPSALTTRAEDGISSAPPPLAAETHVDELARDYAVRRMGKSTRQSSVAASGSSVGGHGRRRTSLQTGGLALRASRPNRCSEARFGHLRHADNTRSVSKCETQQAVQAPVTAVGATLVL